MIIDEVPAYGELQDEAAQAAATCRGPVTRLLDLGAGTGETTRRVAARHPGARVVALDESPAMLDRVVAVVPGADLCVSRLQDPLPVGPFDLVVSALAVHHLNAAGKASLFRRVAAVLRPGSRFVLADVVVPVDPRDAVTPVEAGYDLPSTLDDQLAWLRDAGFDAAVTWRHRDLAVVTADLAEQVA
jgi:tRNA (cmo5U34)-methyltransferase